MRLTSFTDYGLRMLMRIASETDRLHTTTTLANEFGLPRSHLVKIVQRLSEGGIISTQRGRGGGVQLARPAESILLGQLVALLERDQALVECWFNDTCSCTIEKSCRLKARLRHAEFTFLADLNKSTLKDIALDRRLSFIREEV